jgi:hypothetical protein
MGKQSLEWHEEALSNTRAWLKNLIANRDRWQEDVNRGMRIVAFYEAQIEEARRRGMGGFDSERFLKSKNPQNL